MPAITQNLVALTPGGEITLDHLAGWYLLVRIRELNVPLDLVRDAFAKNGLDPDRLPKGRRPEHVMMDACTKAQRVHQNGKRTEIRAQQVGRDENFVIYQMTRHIHDLEQDRVINHEKLLRVLYSFEHNTLSFEPIGGHTTDDVQFLVDEIQSYYDAHRSMMPGRNLRTYVRHYIEDAGALYIVDGDYFIAKQHRISPSTKKKERLIEFHSDPARGEWRHPDTAIDGALFIRSMKGALEAIYRDTAPDLHEIPCVNDEGQREFLKRKFIENCTDDAEKFRNKCMGLIAGKDDRDRAFRADVRANLIKERSEMDARRKQFESIVGNTIDELDRNLGLADQALQKFIAEADV